MRKLYLIFTLVIVIFNISSCQNYTEKLKNIWKKSYQIDYSKGYEFNKPLINEICVDFQKVQKANRQNWSFGYVQECQFLVGLYFRNFIDETEMLEKIQLVFDRFLFKNKLTEKNYFSYSILQYLKGNIAESRKLLKEIYIWDYKFPYTAETLDNYAVKNFFVGIMLEELKERDFSGTIYEEFFLRRFRTELIQLLCYEL